MYVTWNYYGAAQRFTRRRTHFLSPQFLLLVRSELPLRPLTVRCMSTYNHTYE